MPGPNPNRFKTGSLKSRIIHNAQTSIFQVRFALPIAIREFLTSTGRDLNFAGITQEDIELRCHQAVLPGSALATHEAEHDHMGVSDRMAYRRLYDESMDLNFYVDYQYNVIELFDGWMDYISGVGTRASREQYRNPAANYRFRFPEEYKTSFFITKFEKGVLTDPYLASMEYEFINAFPILTNSTPVSYESSNILNFSLRMSYMRYIRVRKIVENPFLKQQDQDDPFRPNFDLNQNFWPEGDRSPTPPQWRPPTRPEPNN